MSSQPAQPPLALPTSLQGLASPATSPGPAGFAAVGAPLSSPAAMLAGRRRGVAGVSADAYAPALTPYVQRGMPGVGLLLLPLLLLWLFSTQRMCAAGSLPQALALRGAYCLQAPVEPPSTVLGWLESALPEEAASGVHPSDPGALPHAGLSSLQSGHSEPQRGSQHAASSHDPLPPRQGCALCMGANDGAAARNVPAGSCSALPAPQAASAALQPAHLAWLALTPRRAAWRARGDISWGWTCRPGEQRPGAERVSWQSQH